MRIKEIEISNKISIEFYHSLQKNDKTVVSPCVLFTMDKYEASVGVYFFFVGFIITYLKGDSI
jgi:hypothetical protein